jgi:hypothetical protein
MSTRDVRDLITAAWATKLRTEGAKNPHTLALELAVIAEAHGVKLTRPAHLHDPAADWTAPVEAAPPTEDWRAARAAMTAAPPPDPATEPENQ